MHLSFAHLAELITHHGILSRHDDEVLERENRTAKRIKSNLIFWGGSSKPEDKHFNDLRAARPSDENDSVTFNENLRGRADGQSVQFARLMLGRKLLLSERKKAIEKSAVVVEHALLKQEEKQELRDKVSSELFLAAKMA
eukprot:6174428-Pleurochrysis_carterae.AAC.1